MTGFPVIPNELVDADWLNALMGHRVWDSSDAGVSFPSASITTGTIPDVYAHLLVVWSARMSDDSSQNLLLRCNGDTDSHYAYRTLTTTSSATVGGADPASSVTIGSAARSGTDPSGGFLLVPAYARAGAHVLWGGFAYETNFGSSGGTAGMLAGYMAVGAAVSSLTFLVASGTLASSSRFTVYGVA